LLLIETHSEHLLLRLLRRIRETTAGELPPGHIGLVPDQLAVAFITKDEGDTKVHSLQVNDRGDFTGYWPKGFFDERSQELF
jgi:predicted ATPase